MKLQFKIQPYQTDAVESTVDIFNGQPNQGLLEYKIDQGKVYVIDNGKRIEQKGLGFSEFDTGYKNSEIVLSEDELLKNIHQIQSQNNIHLSNEVIKRLGACQLDIEMVSSSPTQHSVRVGTIPTCSRYVRCVSRTAFHRNVRRWDVGCAFA